jgi:hypothetical protein
VALTLPDRASSLTSADVAEILEQLDRIETLVRSQADRIEALVRSQAVRRSLCRSDRETLARLLPAIAGWRVTNQGASGNAASRGVACAAPVSSRQTSTSYQG